MLVSDIFKIRKRRKKKNKKILLGAIFLIGVFFVLGFFASGFLLRNITPLKFFRDGKFLIIFQNNAELRSSGGFIGSFATFKVSDFNISDLTFNTNIYKLDEEFSKTHYVEAPGPLSNFLKGKSWTLRDSNYNLSFPEAATDIMDFYQKETGDDVDGVIALNSSVLVDMIKIAGPIKLEDGTEISAGNFYEILQNEVEKKYFENPENWLTNEPKTVLKELYPKLLKKTFSVNKLALVVFVKSEFKTKQVLLYFENPSYENVILDKNMGGAIIDQTDSTGYLGVFENNYSGNKSSLSVEQKISYVLQDLKRVNLAISRTHRGSLNWPDGENDSYLRILAPEGSELISVSDNGDKIENIDITTEAGKTVFGLSTKLFPGESQTLNITYDLPFKMEKFVLLAQKQSGKSGDFLEVADGNKILFKGLLDADKTINE